MRNLRESRFYRAAPDGGAGLHPSDPEVTADVTPEVTREHRPPRCRVCFCASSCFEPASPGPGTGEASREPAIAACDKSVGAGSGGRERGLVCRPCAAEGLYGLDGIPAHIGGCATLRARPRIDVESRLHGACSAEFGDSSSRSPRSGRNGTTPGAIPGRGFRFLSFAHSAVRHEVSFRQRMAEY